MDTFNKYLTSVLTPEQMAVYRRERFPDPNNPVEIDLEQLS
jgi:hypothetical protein